MLAAAIREILSVATDLVILGTFVGLVLLLAAVLS
jgi:hypothetical protein